MDVTVRRGRRRILTGVSLSAAAGDVVLLGGANGAGKSSLLRVLAGVAAPAAGRVMRAGACAYVPEKVALAPALGVREWLLAMGRLRGDAVRDWGPALAAAGLDDAILDARAGALSKGMLQRVALAEALAADVPQLLLDEPFSGLDDGGAAWLGDALAGRDGVTVLTDHTGAAAARLGPARRLVVRGGRCAEEAGAAPALVRIVSIAPDGTPTTHAVPRADGDALLRELLAAGAHIREVR